MQMIKKESSLRSTLGVQLPKDREKEDLTEKVTLLWNAEKDEGSSR